MVEVVKVYMDHLIARDDFLYRRSNIKVSPETSHSPQPFLRLRDLIGENPMNPVLRKPDFQRATWAWSPSECVSLLESFIKEQVILKSPPLSRQFVVQIKIKLSSSKKIQLLKSLTNMCQ